MGQLNASHWTTLNQNALLLTVHRIFLTDLSSVVMTLS